MNRARIDATETASLSSTIVNTVFVRPAVCQPVLTPLTTKPILVSKTITFITLLAKKTACYAGLRGFRWVPCI